jgi:hypothetical protein
MGVGGYIYRRTTYTHRRWAHFVYPLYCQFLGEPALCRLFRTACEGMHSITPHGDAQLFFARCSGASKVRRATAKRRRSLPPLTLRGPEQATPDAGLAKVRSCVHEHGCQRYRAFRDPRQLAPKDCWDDSGFQVHQSAVNRIPFSLGARPRIDV